MNPPLPCRLRTMPNTWPQVRARPALGHLAIEFGVTALRIIVHLVRFNSWACEILPTVPALPDRRAGKGAIGPKLTPRSQALWVWCRPKATTASWLIISAHAHGTGQIGQ